MRCKASPSCSLYLGRQGAWRSKSIIGGVVEYSPSTTSEAFGRPYIARFIYHGLRLDQLDSQRPLRQHQRRLDCALYYYAPRPHGRTAAGCLLANTMLINGEKWACEACVRGHRVSNCQHNGQSSAVVRNASSHSCNVVQCQDL